MKKRVIVGIALGTLCAIAIAIAEVAAPPRINQAHRSGIVPAPIIQVDGNRQVIEGQPDFDARVKPDEITLTPATASAAVPVALQIDAMDGFSKPVHLLVASRQADTFTPLLPAGIHVTFRQKSINTARGARRQVQAVISADRSAFDYPGVYSICLAAAAGKMNRFGEVRVHILPLKDARNWELAADIDALNTEHSGAYAVRVTVKSTDRSRDRIALRLTQSSIDHILTSKPNDTQMAYRFDPPIISQDHPLSTLWIALPPHIADSAAYHLVIVGTGSNGAGKRLPLTINVDMNDAAVVTDSMPVIVQTQPRIFSREWVEMFIHPQEHMNQGNTLPLTNDHANVIPQSVLDRSSNPAARL